MKRRITRLTIVAGTAMLLAACGSMSLDVLSFGGVKEQNTSRPPDGATAYQCDAHQRLFVRYLDNGAAAWVILPEREFRLDKTTADAGTRYSNGSSTLSVTDGAATLAEGAAATYAGCKAAGG